MYRISSFTLYL